MRYHILKLSYCFLLVCAIGVLSCKKEDDTRPGFEMIYQADFSIAAGIGVFDVHHFQLKNIQTRYQQLLEQNQKQDSDIVGILTAEAALTGVFGDVNLDFIDQVSVRVYNESDPNDYIEVAYRQPVPLDPGNTLGLIPSLANSKRFLTGSRFSIDVVLWLRRTTTEENSVTLNLKLRTNY